LDVLDFLQDPEKVFLVDTKKEFVETINNLLYESEKRYDTTIILSDTLLCDTPLVSSLLTSLGYPALHRSRTNDTYRRGIEINSYILGAFGNNPESDYSNIKEFKDSDTFSTMKKTVHNHDPKEDARNILHLFFRTVRVLEEKKNILMNVLDNTCNNFAKLNCGTKN
jgi:hypothetical protein